MSSTVSLDPPFVATARQEELARAYYDPATRVVVADGSYRSGKTQGAARLLVQDALTRPALYCVARQGYRALANSTQRAIMHGDGDLPPLLPREAVEAFNKSDSIVTLRNGSQILFQSLEEGAAEKLRGLTLAAIFVDQLEELDEGEAGERLWDTLLGRLSDRRGRRKLIAASNPGPVTHWAFRRLIRERTRDAGVAVVRFSMRDNPHLPEDYIAAQEATEETRPYYFKSFVLGQWGYFQGAAFEAFDPDVHVVESFPIPPAWDRFEAMDHGVSAPACFHLVAADFDGNLIVGDSYYSPGLISDHCAAVLARRPDWYPAWRDAEGVERACRPSTVADPAVTQRTGGLARWGAPATVATEYLDQSGGHIVLSPGNNDRQAGYARLIELLAPDEDRRFPDWHPRSGELGSPRLFVVQRCTDLIEQLRSAPIEDEGMLVGEAVAAKWEGAHGHATAALRYGCLSRPKPTTPPVHERDESWRTFRSRELLTSHEREVEERPRGGTHVWV